MSHGTPSSGMPDVEWSVPMGRKKTLVTTQRIGWPVLHDVPLWV